MNKQEILIFAADRISSLEDEINEFINEEDFDTGLKPRVISQSITMGKKDYVSQLLVEWVE